MMTDLPYTFFIAVIVTASTACYLFLKNRYNFWKKHGIPGPEPKMFYGNSKPVLKMEMTDAELVDSFCKQYSKEKYIGIYRLGNPVLIVRDLELLKRMLEKDGDHFANRDLNIDPQTWSDSIMKNLIMQKWEQAKPRRAIFSKIFTPRKLKEYYNDMEKCLSYLMKDFEARVGEDVELSEVLRKHAIRIICMQMYGLDVCEDEVRISKLAKYADYISRPSTSLVLKAIIFPVFPWIFKIFNLSLFPASIFEYFSKLLDEMVTTRRQEKVTRNDLLETIMKMREEGITPDEKMSFGEAVGQIYIFFQASFDTSELTLSHAILQLALNRQVQERARAEVEAVLKGSKEITYEHLMEMTYLEGVVFETLRMYPPLGVIDRVCSKPYKLTDTFTIPKGMLIRVPVINLHMDPNYFPEPNIFMPERLNTPKANLDAWKPFGAGPRICIGMRLGRMSVKRALAETLLRYNILPSEKFKSMKFDPKTITFTSRLVDGFWIKLQKRELLPSS